MNNNLIVDENTIKFNSNINLIYYIDYLKMNDFLIKTISTIQKGNYHFSNGEVNFDDILFVDLNTDLKKEFMLSKTSNLRKELVKETISYIDDNNVSIDSFFNEENILKLSNKISEQLSSKKYKLNLINKIKIPSDVIDSFYEISMTDIDDNEISSKHFNQWTLSEAYVDMLLNNKKIENKLIIINDYDQYSKDNGNEILNIIKNLSKNNLVILTTRNDSFFNHSYLLNSLSIFSNEKINNIIFNKTILEKYVLAKDYEGDELKFDTYEINSSDLIDENDINLSITHFANALKPIFKYLFIRDSKIDLSFLNEFIYIAIHSFIKDNDNLFKTKILYKNKLSNLSKYILKKYIEN